MTESAVEKTPESPWMTLEEAAEYLRISTATLHRMRAAGTGPRCHQPGGTHTKILYHREDLDAWVRAEGEPSDDLPGVDHGIHAVDE